MSMCIQSKKCHDCYKFTNICWYEFSQGLSLGSGSTRRHCHINKAIDKLNLGPGQNKSGHGNQAHSSHRKIDPEFSLAWKVQTVALHDYPIYKITMWGHKAPLIYVISNISRKLWSLPFIWLGHPHTWICRVCLDAVGTKRWRWTGTGTSTGPNCGNSASFFHGAKSILYSNEGYQRIQAMCIGAFALMGEWGEWAHGSQIRDTTKISSKANHTMKIYKVLVLILHSPALLHFTRTLVQLIKN